MCQALLRPRDDEEASGEKEKGGNLWPRHILEKLGAFRDHDVDPMNDLGIDWLRERGWLKPKLSQVVGLGYIPRKMEEKSQNRGDREQAAGCRLPAAAAMALPSPEWARGLLSAVVSFVLVAV